MAGTRPAITGKGDRCVSTNLRFAVAAISDAFTSSNTKCGCDLMWRFNPTSVPSRYGTKHQGDEAKEAGSGRGLTRHFSGSHCLLLRLIHRLPVLLLDLVQAAASLVRADVRNAREAIHGLLPRR